MLSDLKAKTERVLVYLTKTDQHFLFIENGDNAPLQIVRGEPGLVNKVDDNTVSVRIPVVERDGQVVFDQFEQLYLDPTIKGMNIFLDERYLLTQILPQEGNFKNYLESLIIYSAAVERVANILG